ncbi:MAG: sulfurtransferase TusA family protein [Aggregatilineales bacterium]
MIEIDVRGLSCPEPVLRTRKALETLSLDEPLVVMVETATSRENVSRMARSKGYNVTIDPTDDGFRLTIAKP